MKKGLIFALLLFGYIGILQAQDVDIILQQGRELYFDGKFTDVISLLKGNEKDLINADTEKYGEILALIGRSYANIDQSSDAEEYLLKAFAVIKNKETANYASVLNGLGVIYDRKGEYSKSEAYYIEAMEIREKVLGKEHREYTQSLINLGGFYSTMGDLIKAEKYYLEAITIFEKILGKEHPDYATYLSGLGNVYNKMRDYAKAEKCYLEVKTIREKILGKEHPYYVQSINNLGNLYSLMGDLTKSEQYHLEAKTIQEKVLGRDHPEYARTLTLLGFLYIHMGDYPKAEKYHLDAKSVYEKVFGKEHKDYAQSSRDLGFLYEWIGDNTKAEKSYLEAKVIQEKVLGKEHPDYALTLSGLGGLYNNIGDYKKAKQFYSEEKNIYEKVFGKEHPDYLRSLNNLGYLLMQMGEYRESEKYFLEGISIQEKNSGKDIPKYAKSLSNLGELYSNMSNYVEAEKRFLEAKTIQETYLGKEHTDYAFSILSLGNVYMQLGDFAKSEEFFLEAKTIGEKNLDTNPHDYAVSLLPLGLLYALKGDYAKAEEYNREAAKYGKEDEMYAMTLFSLSNVTEQIGDYSMSEKYLLEAKAILGKVLGKEHPRYALSLNYLGELYRKTGDYATSEKYHLEAKAIREKVFGQENPVYAESLYNLGVLYSDMDNVSMSEKYHLEAKAIREKIFGQEHLDYANSLLSLGKLCMQKGRYVEAKAYFMAAKMIQENILGKDHLLNISTLANLFIINYYAMNDYTQAEEYLLEATEILENVLGKDNPFYANSQLELAIFYQMIGDYKKVEMAKTECDQTLPAQIEKYFNVLSDRQRSLFWEQNRNAFEKSYSLTYAYPSPSMVSLAYDNTLFTKGLLLRTTNDIRNAIYASGNDELIEKYEQIRNIRQTINTLLSKDAPDLQMIDILENRTDSLDKALTIASGEYKEFKEDISKKWQDVRDALQIGEASVEFVDFRLLGEKGIIDTVFYCALLLKKDLNAPIWIPLFEQSQLDSLLNDDLRLENSLQRLYSGGDSRFFNGQKLYQLVWQPLEEHLQGIETIYYSPSGLLNRISFSAIPIDSICLQDKYDLHLVSSTREVVNEKQRKASFLPVSQSVLYGGIQYDVSNTQELQSAASAYQEITTPLFASRSLPEDSNRSGWNYLQGTESEVLEIDNILKKSNIPNITYMRVAANEESFKALSGNSPAMLHIATHGFFLHDEKQIRQTGFMQLMGDEKRVYRNPLLRSGLLFAGANRAWTNTDVVPGIEDGILTAEEISQLDLSKTKLVILSACETGLGEVQNSEGVFGLQRAFKLAGVETLVMSLWKVDDTATKDFMITFYQNLMEDKSKLQSFKTAQNYVREKYRNPYYWAAFVMMD